MSFKSDSRFVDVAVRATVAKETVVPDGESWQIQRFIGAGAYLADVAVSLVWDYGGAGEEILAVTRGDSNVPVTKNVTGDGVKKLAIVLVNDTAIRGYVIGARWEGIKL